MNKLFNKIFLFIIILNVVIYSQEKENSTENNFIQVRGDSLVGRTVDGEMIREVYGNVNITQGNILITCLKAVQYISRNEAELTGDVVIKQDSVTITTQHGFYYGDTRTSVSDVPVKLDDGKIILTALKGNYFFNEKKAYFENNVVLKDSITKLRADSLSYYKDENRIKAISNVEIQDTSNIIYADTLEYFRDSRISVADNNVRIINRGNNIEIFGNHLEDYPEKKFTLINQKPVLIQVDTTYVQNNNQESPVVSKPDSSIKIDTLVIRSKIMESYRDSSNTFKAIDSVTIIRGNFASENDYTLYLKSEDKIITNKPDSSVNQPILWYENSQLTGDSVVIGLENNKIKFLKVRNNSFIISQNETDSARFDQTSGDSVLMEFENSLLNTTTIYKNVLSIYYQYDSGEPNGLTKSSSQKAVIYFKDKKVDEIRMYGSPNTEYYPENMILGKEKEFILPKYIPFKVKPGKEELLKSKM